MSWFKKIVNRLIKEDENDEIEEYENTIKETETDTDIKQDMPYENIEKPTFRFPIITDAEIYGWEDPTEERVVPKSTTTSENEEDDDFEPIPLYENERWPGRNEAPSNIYRAGSTLKYAEPPVFEKPSLHLRKDVEEEEELPSKSNIPPQRISGRFTPSTVASPIHGFSLPKKTVVREVNGDVKLIAEEEIPTLAKGKTERNPSFEVKESLSYTEPEEPSDESVEETVEIEALQAEEIETAHDKIVDREVKPPEATSYTSSSTAEQQVSVTLPEFVESVEKETTTVQSEEDLIDARPLQAEFFETAYTEEVDVHEVSDGSGQVANQVHADLEPSLQQVQVERVESKSDAEIGEEDEKNTATVQSGEGADLQIDARPPQAGFYETDHTVEEADIHVVSDGLGQVTDQVYADIEPSLQQVQMEEIARESEAEVVDKQATSDELAEETSNFVEAAVDVEENHALPKEEKIVPFNVLMLKSDKEKLAKSLQPVKQVMKSKDESIEKQVQNIEHLQEQPELVSTEIQEIPEEKHYVFPSSEYLIPPEIQVKDIDWLESQSEKLEESLSHFGIQATVIEAVQGPTVTRFELTVGQGTKVSRVRNLTDDLKLALAAQEIRIQAPIPGRSSIGIEIPNRQTRPVRISEVIETEEFNSSDSPLEAVLGLSLTGKPVTLDLRKMPHGMIAGATGSGKSVCINSILISLLYKADPSDLKMMLIDPKMVELAPFNGIPHLISPVITDVKAATAALKWAVTEMDRRYELLAHAGVRDIERYNKLALKDGKYSLKMPYLLIVIDELSDLMMMAPADVEVSISRIAQKARACGIHLIIATQRPSVDVITGTIKANIPTRIAFSVSSQVDSRTIIDTTGAERLLGKGDMLYIGNGQSAAVRLQGTFVTDDEIERIIEHVQHEASPTYLFGQDELLKSAVEEEEADPLFEEACLFVFEQESASTSLLQRNFSIGYNRAAKLMDRMEKRGYISEQRGSRPRDVFLTESDLEQLTTRV